MQLAVHNEVSLILCYIRSLLERVKLNRHILDNPYWYLRFIVDEAHRDLEPVGRGGKGSEFCGKWLGFVVCKNAEGHKAYGERMVVVRHKRAWCHKATCTVCFITGFAVRGARRIEARISKGVSRGYGVIEHVTVSVPLKDYGLDERVLRKKTKLAALDRRVFAGCQIFHGYRIDGLRGVLVWSPHYHILGFCDFERCRKCAHDRRDCYSCSGFKGREARGFEKDGYLVKVVGGRRDEAFGTAFYQLNHATVRVSAFRRSHVVSYFGACANRKYGAVPQLCRDVCPVCGSDMVRARYEGKRHICKDLGSVAYRPWFLDDELDENGEPNYSEVIGGRDESG